jgi:hypothetical protein
MEKLPLCKFTTTYYNEETRNWIGFKCEEESLGYGFCIFHDENYLQDQNNRKEHEQRVTKELMDKVSNSITQKTALLCIGYYFPDNITIRGTFPKPVYFSESKFQQVDFVSAKFSDKANFGSAKFSDKANFSLAKFSGEEANFSLAKFSGGGTYFSLAKFSGGANFNSSEFSGGAYFYSTEFSGGAYFISAKFSGEANFDSAKFSGEANFSDTFKDGASFNYVLFEDGKKILFDGIDDLSNFSFMNTDITRVRFSDRARWGKEDKFKITDEEKLTKSESSPVSLGSVMAVYRNLRENYEYRLRYDEAGKFFIKEMELKRLYREEKNILADGTSSSYRVVQNGLFRRNFSLTGFYYHLSKYGEDLLRPTLVGIVIVFLSTLFWLTQSNPVHEPSLSHLIGLSQIGNHTQWYKSFERSLSDLIPLLPSGSHVEIGLLDYVIKIVGGALTFGLIAIALRRKFERKYTR